METPNNIPLPPGVVLPPVTTAPIAEPIAVVAPPVQEQAVPVAEPVVATNAPAVPTKEYKGIGCPNASCGAVEEYTTGNNKKTTDVIERRKTCKVCGTIFRTMEVPVGVVTINNNHVTPQ